MTIKDETADKLETCKQCGHEVKFDEERFCPNCGTQPLFTVRGKDTGKVVVLAFAITFVITVLLTLTWLYTLPPTPFSTFATIFLFVIMSTSIAISLSLIGLIMVTVTIETQMGKNLRNKQPTDRYSIRKWIVGRFAFFGALAFFAANYLTHGEFLAGVTGGRLTGTGLTVGGFLGGAILGGLGGGIGAAIGQLVGLLVVPVRTKEPAGPEAA